MARKVVFDREGGRHVQDSIDFHRAGHCLWIGSDLRRTREGSNREQPDMQRLRQQQGHQEQEHQGERHPEQCGERRQGAEWVRASDLGDEPGLEFLNNPGQALDIDVTTTYQVVRSLAVSAPSSGFVTCIAAGQADWDVADKSLSLQLGWDAAGGTTDPVSANFIRGDNRDVAGGGDLRVPITAMHTFLVGGAGTVTYRLKARCFDCVAGEMDYSFHSAACMFFPTQY